MAPSVSPSPPPQPPSERKVEEGVDVEGAWAPPTCWGGRKKGWWGGCCSWGRCCNAIIYLTVLAGLAVLLLGVVAPQHTVISCHDPNIRRENRKDTVSIPLLFTVAFLVPFFKMLILEWLVPPAAPPGRSESPLRAGVQRSWGYLGDLFVGGLFMYFTTDLLKTTVGEARPNFWQMCRPNLTEAQCEERYVRVSWENCTNPHQLKHWRLAETMKSFPSGHASISVFSALFIMAYTHKRLCQRGPSLLSPFLQLVWGGWVVVCCTSRIWDNKHFWWDVLAGAGIGGVFAFLTLHYISNWFEREEEEETTLISTRKEATTAPSPSPSSSSYIPEEEEEEEGDNLSRFSSTSCKRLINGGRAGGGRGGGGGGAGGGGRGGGGGTEKELRDIDIRKAS